MNLHFLTGIFLLVPGEVLSTVRLQKRSSAVFKRDVGTTVNATSPQFESWGATTTIFEPSVALSFFAENFKDHGLVVVGDKKTNHSAWRSFVESHPNTFYLAPDDQEHLSFQEVIKNIPWNHFGRKSIGYLYAINHGAMKIFDFDDDNLLDIKSFDVLSGYQQLDVVTNHLVYNPYPFFNPEQEDGSLVRVWPRGQPLRWINDNATYLVKTIPSTTPRENLAVIQSLADNDPDVDAVYRMTQPLPIKFTNREKIIVPPRRTFTPFNSQATYVMHEGFFGLLLPVTVPGRVSDIWRSYILERLLWDTDYKIGFSSPFVTQYRNPHSYQKDFEDEDDLYHKCDLLLSTLATWTSDGLATLDLAYLSMIETLVKVNILGAADLTLAQAWVKDLSSLNYAWPRITQRQEAFKTRDQVVVDGRIHSLIKKTQEKIALLQHS